MKWKFNPEIKSSKPKKKKMRRISVMAAVQFSFDNAE